MKNLIFISFLLITTLSCGQEDKWNRLKKEIEKSVKICDPCIDEFGKKKVKYLTDVLNKDFNTKIFDKLNYNRQISFTFCQNKYKELGYLDCMYIIELSTKNIQDADAAFKFIEQIPNTTIHFVPPQLWKWIKRDNKIYLLYSNVYRDGEYEFEEIKGIMYKIL